MKLKSKWRLKMIIMFLNIQILMDSLEVYQFTPNIMESKLMFFHVEQHYSWFICSLLPSEKPFKQILTSKGWSHLWNKIFGKFSKIFLITNNSKIWLKKLLPSIPVQDMILNKLEIVLSISWKSQCPQNVSYKKLDSVI